MKLDILMSCMHQTDEALIHRTGITGNAVIINQCDHEGCQIYPTQNGTATMYSTTQRGLTKSRNMAIRKSQADICVLCDDDEHFADDYATKIINAYKELPTADVIIFKISNRPASFPDRVQRLRFPKTMKVSSWQISFRRSSLIEAGVSFDERLGAGTGNGAEEELKFLLDCQKAKLKIYYVPEEIASVEHTSSTWFFGFDESFFVNRGATTRYILGFWLSAIYAVYYVIAKRKMYSKHISPSRALGAIFRGIWHNKLSAP